MNKIKRLLKATFSFVKNYYSDYEVAYEEGWAEGQEEGIKEGFAFAKTDGAEIWKDVYRFLQERKWIEKDEEISAFEMFERLISYDRDLNESVAFWRKRANDRNEDNV